MKTRSTLTLLGLATLATLSPIGCSSSGSALNVNSENSGTSYVANFNRAYFTEARDGQMDLVLLSDDLGTDATIDRPLTTRDDRRVKQIVHIRILWAPTRGLTQENPSANNAMISWHVVASPDDRLTYSGNCWARAKVDGDEATIDLERATVSISQIVGHVSDPLKRAKIDGEIVARRSDSTVRSYIDELALLSTTNATALSGPPTRTAPTP